MKRSYKFVGYADSEGEPNVVMDGSPNEGTVLTLTHWPGYPQPDGFHFDLSAEMAFHHLDAPIDHPPADAVTNNHFDQDGLVGIHTLVHPEGSLEHRRVADRGRGGRRLRDVPRPSCSTRASMIIDAYADAERSPIASSLVGSYDEQCVVLYSETLPMLVSIATDSDRYRDLWADEDAQLSGSETALNEGVVTIEELSDIDLAIVTIPDNETSRGGHRFAGMSFESIHPMALHNATGCFRLLVIHGRRYQFVDRYETWVQYRSRRPLPRVDMRPLAEQLTAHESGAEKWSASAPGSLTPIMRVDGESSTGPDVLSAMVVAHLRTSPPAGTPTLAEKSAVASRYIVRGSWHDQFISRSTPMIRSEPSRSTPTSSDGRSTSTEISPTGWSRPVPTDEPGIDGAILPRMGERPAIGAPIVGMVNTMQVDDLDALDGDGVRTWWSARPRQDGDPRRRDRRVRARQRGQRHRDAAARGVIRVNRHP